MLAQPNDTGKPAWQQLVVEAVKERSAARLALLIRAARTSDAARAIARHAEQYGLADSLVSEALAARTREPGSR